MAQNRFEEKFVKTDGCWIWNAATDRNGYGVFSYNGKRETSSRISYIFYKGSISNGLHVLHTCDNPSCVNPDHLFLGTNKDNVEDRKAKNRPVGRHKIITTELMTRIKEHLGSHENSYRAISRELGVSRETIRRIANGKY